VHPILNHRPWPNYLLRWSAPLVLVLGMVLASSGALVNAVYPQLLSRAVAIAIFVGLASASLLAYALVRTLTQCLTQTNAELRYHRGWLHDLFDLSSDWLWEQDALHRFTRISIEAQMPTEFRYSLDALIGNTRWEIPWAEELPETYWQEHRRQLDAREPFHLRLPRRSLDGHTNYLDIFGKPHFDDDGVFLGYRGIGRNVTQGVEAERALRESEERFRGVFDTVDSIALRGYDADGHVHYWNRASTRLFGYTADEARGVCMEALLLDGAERGDFVSERARLLATGASQAPRYYQAKRRDGAVVEIYSTQICVPLQDGRREFYCVDLDMSPIRNLERDLAESREHYRQLFNLSPDAVVVYSDGVIRLANEAAARIFGTDSVERFIGRSIFEFIMPEDHARVRHRIAALEATQTPTPMPMVELKHVTLDGQPLTLESTVTRLSYHGQPVFMAALRDVTKRQQAESEIRRLNETLEQRVRERTAELMASNQELESFAYSVSHDLRTPLRGIDGFARIIEQDYGDKLDAAGHGHIARIRQASQRMAQLIDDMLDLARITRVNMARRNVDLSALAKTILANLKADPDHQVDIVVANDLRAEADPALLRVALEHLLRNAWKFSSTTANARIEVGVIEHDHERAFFVRDNGAGFDATYAGKLFRPFQRLHRSNEYPGNGIGLATVHRVIHRHGGRVWAEGVIDQGATFYFTLP